LNDTQAAARAGSHSNPITQLKWSMLLTWVGPLEIPPRLHKPLSLLLTQFTDADEKCNCIYSRCNVARSEWPSTSPDSISYLNPTVCPCHALVDLQCKFNLTSLYLQFCGITLWLITTSVFHYFEDSFSDFHGYDAV